MFTVIYKMVHIETVLNKFSLVETKRLEKIKSANCIILLLISVLI